MLKWASASFARGASARPTAATAAMARRWAAAAATAATVAVASLMVFFKLKFGNLTLISGHVGTIYQGGGRKKRSIMRIPPMRSVGRLSRLTMPLTREQAQTEIVGYILKFFENDIICPFCRRTTRRRPWSTAPRACGASSARNPLIRSPTPSSRTRIETGRTRNIDLICIILLLSKRSRSFSKHEPNIKRSFLCS